MTRFSGALAWVLAAAVVHAQEAGPLAPWQNGVRVRPVAPHSDRHTLHAYFNACPESPDGRYVLYYTSSTPEGESGDLRVLERSTGKETVVATDIRTEDAHRAACQQWSNRGRTIVYHDHRDGRWRVMAVDLDTLKPRVLAHDRQVSFGSPGSPWVPLYGCHWNPGEFRDLQRVNVVTGEIQTVLTVREVVRLHGDWIAARFGTTDVSIFFPIMSPDDSRVFFKLSKPGGGNDFKSRKASDRDGKGVYDLKEGRFIRLIKTWGHPSWSPDSTSIFEKGNMATDVVSGRVRKYAPSCFSDHPSMSPDGRLFVTDADVSRRPIGKPGHWAVAVGSTLKDEFIVLHVFGNSRGATSWRRNHPHPSFSADGKRIYYTINEGRWTALMIAESSDEGF